MDEYGPGALELVAAVEQVGCVVSAVDVWPFLNPENCGVIVGGVPPWVNEPLDAVMDSGAV